jgi:hypothetical protein
VIGKGVAARVGRTVGCAVVGTGVDAIVWPGVGAEVSSAVVGTGVGVSVGATVGCAVVGEGIGAKELEPQ